MGAPDAHRFVVHRHTSLSKQVLGIAQTQGEAMVREHRVRDDFGRKTVAMIERIRNVHRIIVLERRLA